MIIKEVRQTLFLIKEQKIFYVKIIINLLISSSLEIFTLWIIGEYLSCITDQARKSNEIIEKLINNEDALLIYGLILIITVSIKMIFNINLNNKIVNAGYSQKNNIGFKLFEHYQSLDYQEYIKKNSSEYLQNITNLSSSFAMGVVIPGLRVICDAVSSLAIILYVAFQSPLTIFLIGCTFGVTIFIYNKVYGNKLVILGKGANESAIDMDRSLKEYMKGFKEIRVLGYEVYFFNKYKNSAINYSKNETKRQQYTSIPRYIFEFVLFLTVFILVELNSLSKQNPMYLIPNLGVLAFAGIRLLPLISNITSSISNIKYNSNTIEKLYKIIKNYYPAQLDINKSDLQKINEIIFTNVSYKYNENDKYAIKDINIRIKKGESLAIVGMSGSGKTTIVDLMLGLLHPTTGSISVNGEILSKNTDMKKFGFIYLPQDLLIIDDTLKENICLSGYNNEYDEDLLNKAINFAKLDSLVHKAGINLKLGEGGVFVSGGQRQRIALARAYYHQREIIVLDESTSALDKDTESEIIREIQVLKNNKTVIIITHNENILKSCDQVLRV